MEFRAQTTIELLIITAAGLVVVGALLGFAGQQLRILEEQKAVKTAEVSLNKIVDASNEVFSQGKGAVRSIEIVWPEGIDSSLSSISHQHITIRVFNRTIDVKAIPTLTGTLPTTAGYHVLTIKAYDGYVTIGDVSLSVSPTIVFSPLQRDHNSSTRLTITNAGTSSATLAFTNDWNNNTDVNLVLSSSSGSIATNGTYPLDVNFYANHTATGGFPGNIWIQGTFSDKVETLVVPLKASISINSNSGFSVYPAALTLPVYLTDLNSSVFQLCNTTSSPLKSITFIPSTGDGGEFIQGISNVPELGAFSCIPVTVWVQALSSTIGSFGGSIFITDYLGNNIYTLPITIQVNGMNGIFSWNWDTATKSLYSVSDFTLANVGNVPVGIDQVVIRNWWGCDSQDANLTEIQFNDTTLFSGSNVDGNWMDVPDINIPVLTSWTNNLLVFDQPISDQNETFIAEVLFTDETKYTTSIFGTGCADTTPPSAVNDLIASSGPEPGTVLLSFTYPGDDGNIGMASSVIVKFSHSYITTQTAFDNANSFAVDQPFGLGGTPGTILVTDLNIGNTYYFAVEFQDENDNAATISNDPDARPWNSFQWSGGDFNFSNMTGAVKLVAAADTNKFDLSNIDVNTLAPRMELGFLIREDENFSTGYNIYFNFDATNLTRIRVWYPNGELALPNSTPNFDGAYSTSWNTRFNLLSPALINAAYAYAGTAISISRPDHFFVYLNLGIQDFNVKADRQDAGAAGSE